MDARYHYGHKPARHRRKHVFTIAILSLVLLAAIGAFIARDIFTSSDNAVSGTAQTVMQAGNESAARLIVSDPLFTMELPGDWKELNRRNNEVENSITWQSTKSQQEGRSLTIHIDKIPVAKAVNRLFPLMAQGNTITVGDISENCATFTPGGTLNVHEAAKLKETPAKWNKVDFICDLPRVNDNVVGTGSPEGVNTITLAGPSKGTHKYFFLYTDHNVQSNYEILANALRSFKAK